MNMKKWKRRTLALLLALLVGVTGLKQAAYAEEITPTSYTVTDYTSFKEALFYAMDGDQIVIMGSVALQSNINIGSTAKSLTIKRGTAQSTISFSGGGNNVTLENITFDGGGYEASSPFVYVATNSAIFSDCVFQNCGVPSRYLSCNSIGGAIRVDSGTNQFIGCQFKNNVGIVGGHMVIYDGTVQITDCTFTGGTVMSNGGAICINGNTAQCVINSSIITGNKAGDFGGGISNMGEVIIDDSMIYGNTATNGGADIANKIFGTTELKNTIEQLAELFEPEKILPVAWVSDYDFEENLYIPDVDPYQENALLKLQYEIIPDDSEDETESTEPGTEEGTESTEPGTDVPDDSEQDITPDDTDPSDSSQSVGDTNTDNSTQTDNSNNSVNTDNSDNSTQTDNSDNSSVDNSVTNNDSSSSSTMSNNTVDNSSVDNSKVDNSKVSNSSDSSTTTTNTTTTTNNYYTNESNQSPGQAIAQPIVIQVQNDSAAPDADNEIVSDSDSSSPNIRIDAQGVDCVFEYVDGVYNVSITAQKEADEPDAVVPAVTPVQAVEDSVGQEVDWLEGIQMVLLVAILICLIWQPKRTGNRNIQG